LGALVLVLLASASFARADTGANARVLQTATPVAAILMYHHVSDVVLPGPYARALTVQPAEFARHLQRLRSAGCETVTVDTIVADVRSAPLRHCEIAITFDDGYVDDVAAAAQLAAAGSTATLYVSSGLVGTPGHVSRAQLSTLADDGLQIGAHTINHVDLTTLGDAQAAHEIAGSRASLAAWSGTSIDSFAYPAGRYDARVERLVRASGFQNAATTQPGRVTSAALADPFALPRYRIERDTGAAVLARVVGSPGTPGLSPQELRSIARRRAEGNDPQLAERIGAALLNASYPEPLLKVRVLRIADATFVGLMLSGVKLHARVDRAQFEADVGGMVDRAFAARPDIAEVDVWAVEPLEVQPSADVSGDYAVPTTRTVFSCAVTRAQAEATASRTQMLGTMYWGPSFLKKERAP
jgi:peptidoglycan/xylan/chitin deacetylase (PgdA/CDA1 family)